MIPNFIKKFFKKSKNIDINDELSSLMIEIDDIQDSFDKTTTQIDNLTTQVFNSYSSSLTPSYTIASSNVVINRINHNVGGYGGITYTITDDYVMFGPHYDPLGLEMSDFEDICKLAKEHPCMHDALENLKISYELVRKQPKLNK